MISLTVNGQSYEVDVEPDTPLLWAIRENVGLTGTKYGCGIAQCGACTVDIDGTPVRSCSLPASEAVGKTITTIEGLAQNGKLHPVQQVWLDLDVPQCGYCQSGYDNGGGGAVEGEAKSHRRRHRCSDHQHLSVRHLSTCARRHPRGCFEGVMETTMNYMPKIDRRSFLVSGTAAGLSIGLRIPFGDEAAAQTALPPEVNAWVVVQPDDTVIIRIARVDMGQGTLTGLAQLVAEELECDWSKVTWEYPSPGRNVARNRIWQNYQTAGSQGIRQSQKYVREGGVAARMMLIQAAANEWKVPAAECVAANSVITHKPSGRTTTYGKVAEAAGKLEVPKDPPLKDPKDWKIAGKPLKRLDTPDKITGKQVYAIDTKLPGMLNAAIKACPVIGGKVKSFDAAKVESLKGVKKVVPVGDYAVAVVADTWWHAKTALDALPIVWDEGENAKRIQRNNRSQAKGRSRR